ncbi:hypothetical protein DSO57_1034544 [Entomophthora muscae]|uniref:Uncharacterized protein n=1 Tax=Entomophthora muscae TaxID=34485 RepID=A0ACC2TAJ0_9FUNG|nr:hypothetical protein DSO57_1034544 [Entomophthora muscae]
MKKHLNFSGMSNLIPFSRHLQHIVLKKNVPLVIVSGGPKFLLEYFFKRFFPDDYTKFRIEANYGENIGRKWNSVSTTKGMQGRRVLIYIASEYGHDKGVTMKQIQDEYAAANNGAKPYTVFCGDGVSDLSAARHADLLFVRRGRGLEGYCQAHKIPFTGFDDFQVILAEVQKLKGSN